MGEMIAFMAAPFTACIVLLGIHCYFGLHVLKREIIFIDIAMAQVAAFGAAVSSILAIAHDGGEHWFSIAMTAGAAVLFTLTKTARQKIPQEAVIGVVYAMAAMGALLLAERMIASGEHFHAMLEGSILWVDWPEILHLAWIFALIGIFHWVFRKKFFALSFDFASARSSGMKVRLWDFLFYLSFGWMLVHSVEVGGVLFVFGILVLPASISFLISGSLKARILISWAVGMLCCALALVLSWKLDLPSGPAVICVLGAAFLLAGLGRRLLRALN